MPEDNRFYDIFFIFHPADIEKVGRIAAQIRATGINALFSEDEFGRTADGVKQLRSGILRSYTVAFALSPDSAESQLCNELLQYAVSKGKRLVTLILDDAIEVEVHPAIAQNPYVFFREDDDLAGRVEALRAYLPADGNLKRHTELLVLAENWRDRGRPPDLLLPPDRLDEMRRWLATAAARHPKPSALQLEYVHGSRRQPPRRRRARPILAGMAAVFALAAVLFLLQRVISGWQSGRVAGASTNVAQTQAAVEASAASDSAIGLIDIVAATGAVARTAVAQSATTESITSTAVAQVSQAAQTRSDIRATQMRATEIAELERDDVARRLVAAGEEALAQGDIELALALAWEAKDGLDNPLSAHRLLRRAAATTRALTLDDVALLRIHPAGVVFALVPGGRDELQIYDGESWSRQVELSEHDGMITALVYSSSGARLISASDDGEIIIRDGLTGAAERRSNKHGGAVTALALAPDDRVLISAGSEPLLVAWDIESGEELAAYAAEAESEFEIQDLVVPADAERVIAWYTAGGRTVMAQWSLPALELISADSGGRVYRGVDSAGRIGYSGGSSLPAYPGDGSTGDLILWDLSSGEERARLTDGFNWSFLSGGGLAASDDLRFVSFSEELALVVVDNSESGQHANLINIADGRLLRRFEGEIAEQMTSAEFISADAILSATSDNRVLHWSSSDGRLIRELGVAPRRIDALQVNIAANLVIAQTDDGASHLWQLEAAGAAPLMTLTDALPGTAISQRGDTVILVEQESLSVRAVDSGATRVKLPARLVSLAGDRFAVYSDGRLGIYDAETGVEVRVWLWEASPIVDLQLSPGGQSLLAFSESTELWLVHVDAEAPLRLAGDAAQPSLVRFSPSGELILSVQGELARLWDGDLGLAQAAYPLGAADRVDLQAAFSADGDSLMFYLHLEDGLASLTTLALADNDARRQTFIDVQAGALSSDGERLSLAFDDGRLQVVSTRSSAILHEVDGDAGAVRKLQYQPQSKTLVAAIGSELILWDVEDRAIDQRFPHPHPLVGFSISRDGRRILTSDESGAFRLWQVEIAEELLARIESEYAPRALTCAEREQHLAAPLCE